MHNPTPAITQTAPSSITHNTNVHLYRQPEALPDLTQIQVNTALPVRERIQRFIADIGNPYLFRVGDTIVHVRYSPQPATLQERLIHLASK